MDGGAHASLKQIVKIQQIAPGATYLRCVWLRRMLGFAGTGFISHQKTRMEAKTMDKLSLGNPIWYVISENHFITPPGTASNVQRRQCDRYAHRSETHLEHVQSGFIYWKHNPRKILSGPLRERGLVIW